MEYASEQQVQYSNNTFTHCNSTTLTTSVAPVLTSIITAATSALPATTTTTTTATTTSTSSSHANTASVVGGAIGGIAGLALILGTGFVYWRKRNQSQPFPKTNRNEEMMSAITPYTLTSLGRHTFHLIHVRPTHATPPFQMILVRVPLALLNRLDIDRLLRISLRTLGRARTRGLHILHKMCWTLYHPIL